eukprot:TRINITY_DN5039_c0_g2_i2.p1 TRINITY_DN5039_c0_g2~~TRINITY_DN5039_c0_g2_i2.p1  ORF type:complete len:340 (-),score=81.35 TRINITY_DN5039_c0_g2_i2:205-1224(-)
MLGEVFPEYLSKYATDVICNETGLETKSKVAITSVEQGENSNVKVTLSDNSTLEVDHIVVAVGTRPEVNLARNDLEIDERNGGIAVNHEMQTSRSDIYAAGDVVSFPSSLLGRRRVEFYDHARMSGKYAGYNMAGNRKSYLYQPSYIGDLGSLRYEAVGLIDNSLETVGVWEKPGSKKPVRRIKQASAPSASAPASSTNQEPKDGGNEASKKEETSDKNENVKMYSPNESQSEPQSHGQSVSESDSHPTKSDEQDSKAATSTESASAIEAGKSQDPFDPVTANKFEKGIVYYLKNDRIVGVLLWNFPDRVPEAKRALSSRKPYSDRTELRSVISFEEQD